MTTQEAVEALAERARRAATVVWLLAALALLVAGSLAGGGLVLLQWMLLGVASIKVAAAGGLLVGTGVVVPVFRVATRTLIGARRRAWIDELARAEGIDAAELAQYFTTDSW